MTVIGIGRAAAMAGVVAGEDVDFEEYHLECNLWAHMDSPEAKDQGWNASRHEAGVKPGLVVTVGSAAGGLVPAAVERAGESLCYWAATFAS